MNTLDYVIQDSVYSAEDFISELIEAGAELQLKDDQGNDRFSDIPPEFLKLLQEKAASITKEEQPD